MNFNPSLATLNLRDRIKFDAELEWEIAGFE